MVSVPLRTRDARATVTTTAGMLLDAVFERDGRMVAPFARAPWAPDPARGRPAHLDVLGAEFVAVPFGSAGRPDRVAGEWHGLVAETAPDLPHGLPANAEWEVLDRDEASVLLGFEVAEGPVRRLERRVRLREGEPVIEFELTVLARSTAAVPIGIHPIFRLPTSPSSLRVDVPFTVGHTYPGVVPPGAAAARPGSTFSFLRAVPGVEDDVVDLARLPLGRPVEDVVLLAGLTGPVVLRFDDDRSGAVLDWDRAVLPSLLLWISDRALGGDPWDHRYRGLGVEPIAAAFDLPPETSTAANPLSDAGIRTAVGLEPGSPLVVRSTVAALFPPA